MKAWANRERNRVNYYERYCGDYQRDTAHLSLAEHGAYTMLLDTYFSVEKPLPSDLPSLYRVCRAMTRLEQQAVKTVAEQFFPVSEADGLRHNRRADREIAKARPKIEAARINGRKGGRPPARTPQAGHLHPPHSAVCPDLPGTVPPGHATPGSPSKPEGFEGFLPGYPVTDSGVSHGRTRPEPGGKALQPQPQLQSQRQLQPQPQPQPRQEGERFLPADMESDDRANPSCGNPLPVQSAMAGSGTEAGAPGFSEGGGVAADGAPGKDKAGVRTVPEQADACCTNLRQLGIRDCNPHHSGFLALLRAGAAEDEFQHAARAAAARGKASFAYVVGTVKRQREEAAGWIQHRGRMPNRQEQLEAANGAAAEGWLPPELRGEGANAAHTRREEAGDADR